MLTEIQTVILTCLLGPEDKGAFKRAQSATRVRNWRGQNPEKTREKQREVRRRNPERAKRYKKKWEKANREVHLAYKRRQYHTHAPAILLKKKDYLITNREKIQARWLARYHSNPQSRLAQNMRTRIRRALRVGTKSASTAELIGCPFVWLEVHLESLFRPGMTWENQGSKWHIDHIKPCAKFDLTSPEQQKICFHWTNLQPLFAVENLKKGDKYAG